MIDRENAPTDPWARISENLTRLIAINDAELRELEREGELAPFLAKEEALVAAVKAELARLSAAGAMVPPAVRGELERYAREKELAIVAVQAAMRDNRLRLNELEQVKALGAKFGKRTTASRFVDVNK